MATRCVVEGSEGMNTETVGCVPVSILEDLEGLCRWVAMAAEGRGVAATDCLVVDQRSHTQKFSS